MPSGVIELLKDRENEYKGAWRLTGKLLGFLFPYMGKLFEEANEFSYSWVIVLNKLIRILGSPRHLDSWKDIEGYAHLVVEELEGETDDEVH